MGSLLLETDVFSYFFRHDDRRLPYRDDLRGHILCISFASVAELKFGAIRAGWGASRRQSLQDAFRQYIMLVADAEVTECWAAIKAERDRTGRPIASEDCWIAATAIRYGIASVTHNLKDFEGISDLRIICH